MIISKANIFGQRSCRYEGIKEIKCYNKLELLTLRIRINSSMRIEGTSFSFALKYYRSLILMEGHTKTENL